MVDFAGGSKALQAVVGGSADVVSGAFERTVNMQFKGQPARRWLGACAAGSRWASAQDHAHYNHCRLARQKIGVHGTCVLRPLTGHVNHSAASQSGRKAQ